MGPVMGVTLNAAAAYLHRVILLCACFWISGADALPRRGAELAAHQYTANAATTNSRRLLDEEGVEIEPMVIHLLAIVCGFAFLPPIICKLRQMFCQNKVDDYLEEQED